MKEKVVLVNDLSPGDVLIMSAAIRSLHKAYPDRYETDVRSPAQEIFFNSPYITKFTAKDHKLEHDVIEILKKNESHPPIEIELVDGTKAKYVIAHYPEIHRSGMSGLPFVDGHRMFLEKQLNVPIPRSGMKPDLFFSDAELKQPRKVAEPYWIINAGIKNDYTLKYYAHYQEVVNLLKGEIQFVQVGHSAHNHPPLEGVLDLRGKTNLRELFLLSHHAEGSVNCVSMQMVIMACLSKPCVVVAGAREGVRWQLNPDHQFLYRNGVMSCATYDGCWKSKIEDCVNRTESGDPLCLELIAPQEVARAVRLYYLGGRLKNKEIKMEVPFVETINNEVEDAQICENDTNTYFRNTEELEDLERFASNNHEIATSAIINTLRILKKHNPEDKYLEAYYWHMNKNKEKWFDLYHFLWWLGTNIEPQRVLEIGCRTGVSISQLLSSYRNYGTIQKIVLCDLFAELGDCDTVLANLEYLNIPTDKVSFLYGSSIDEMPKLIVKNDEYDYILVDGCHEKEVALVDLENAHRLLDKGGYIAFDDLTPDGCSLQDVWDKWKESVQGDYEFFENHNGKGLGVARRIK